MNVATRISEQDGCVVVSVDGELDLGTAEQLQETLTTAIAEAAGPIVLAFNAGHNGKTVESSSPSELMAGALHAAKLLFGDDITPVDVMTSSWTRDPYALGSYSFHAPGSGPDDRRRLQEPISDRLYFAGEAVGVDNPATVHGALLSGRHAAEELMRRLHG